MAQYKASGIVSFRTLIHKKGEKLEEEFLKLLTPEESNRYKTAFAAQWLPLEELAQKENLMTKAANFLFPSEADPVFSLGQAVAEVQFSGIYRFFMSLPQPHMILSRNPKMWSSFQDVGSAEYIKKNETSGIMIVKNHPTLPAVLRHYLIGVLTRALMFTGVKNPKVIQDDQDPNAWKWTFVWDK